LVGDDGIEPPTFCL